MEGLTADSTPYITKTKTWGGNIDDLVQVMKNLAVMKVPRRTMVSMILGWKKFGATRTQDCCTAKLNNWSR